jgi:K(+)-stimulated pyrophosphate-energized sodium pump
MGVLCSLANSISHILLIEILCGISIILTIYLYFYVIKQDNNDEKGLSISNIIRSASMTYLKKQYSIIFGVAVAVGFLVYYIFGCTATICFGVGVSASSLAGFYNMNISTLANIRTVQAAKKSLQAAFKVSFLSGAAGSVFLNTLGCLVVFGVIVTSNCYNLNLTKNLIGLSIGASLVSVFARLGGGIFTKGADVGADLVGKLEIGLNEDDYRNPAVIADNVGDNVGDCAGMSADLMESYIVSLSAATIIFLKINSYFPLLICVLGLVSCFIPLIFMRYKKVWKEMLNYFNTSCLLFCGFSYLFKNSMSEWYCLLIGVAAVASILKVTEYYTSSDFSPIKKLAEVSKYGAGNNIIFGLALSYESVVLPCIIVISGILGCYMLCGLHGITLGVISIVALSPAILVLDLYGPITDNAGGIAEMSNNSEIRPITDELDAIGNTTKAITKGYAIGSAIFAAVIMFYLFQEDLLAVHGISLVKNLSDPVVLCGIIMGAIVPYLFAGLSMKSVSIAAGKVVQEVRRQIQNNPGILDGSSQPDYHSTITFLTKISIQQMILPSLLPIVVPVAAFTLGYLIEGNGFALLASCLLGVTIIGSLISISATVAGGAWDNTKKFIEMNEGKSSKGYAAAVIGDTVGDPLKDTTGPSLNSVIKLANLVGMMMIYLR